MGIGQSVVVISGGSISHANNIQGISNEIARQAVKYTEYAWNDIMLGFREIGYDPTQNEKEALEKRIAKLEQALKEQSC